MTIEERAEKFCTDNGLPSGACASQISYGHTCMHDGYIAGANEQKSIDDADLHKRFEKVLNGQKWDLIDRACEWFANYLGEIGYPDDWLRDSQNMTSGEQRFRKAMEK